ncbi:heavy metal translocating P-type ATPase [Microbacterium endophyticum]|uniref:Heavy metal translocating P-type ATPase n=1 Tax=Microbacterium endophyticum TaxID=1526412 RepID=A0A7W4V328_9MICO|nr:heavy metal translocating P-type ATPase [Microbacterium endophyticum]MBB2975258.1 heavy metal translocating P-type ATPase [Microbacterium endophyticum]NIK35723.1 heavy metal translocating P-type ATPase [Microbacterium endophyticum]
MGAVLGRTLAAARRFPWVTATIGVAIVAGVLAFTPWAEAGFWLIVTYVVAMALRSAWAMVRALLRGIFGVDIIAVTAIVAAVLVGEEWAALVVVLMLTTGQALEEYAAHRAQRDLTALLSRNPQTAHRVTASGEIEEVPVTAVMSGERILVRANELVPVDGLLVSAAGAFDQSSLTGESLPVEKVAGDEILSGTVNGAASVILDSVREAKDSQYQLIVALVERAAATKAPVVRLADRFALPFALAAYAIAGAAWWVSQDPARFAEVLVVATPCPLIIAAPVAFMAGMSRAAREGIIIRSSATRESLHRARTFAFDKTGTLTRGTPTLLEVRSEGSTAADALLRAAASVEATSAHVLAAATVSGAEARGIVLDHAEDAFETTASGVTAEVVGQTVAVGKRDFIAAHLGSDVRPAQIDGGEIAIYVAIAGAFGGVLVFRDQLRENAAETLERIRALGIRNLMMLTGDGQVTADHIASSLGLTDVHANCLPADKVALVAGASARPAAMVGDGINDAPVLAAADIGIAMGARGATAASEAADIVILRDDVSRVADALAIGRRTVNVGLQSIWVGIGLSLGLMVLAAFGFVPALVGAWLQEGVDVVAIAWALRATRPGSGQ